MVVTDNSLYTVKQDSANQPPPQPMLFKDVDRVYKLPETAKFLSVDSVQHTAHVKIAFVDRTRKGEYVCKHEECRFAYTGRIITGMRFVHAQASVLL